MTFSISAQVSPQDPNIIPKRGRELIAGMIWVISLGRDIMVSLLPLVTQMQKLSY